MMYHFIRSGTFKPCPQQKISIPLLRESPWVICLSEEPKVCAVFHTQGMCQNASRKIIQLKEKILAGAAITCLSLEISPMLSPVILNCITESSSIRPAEYT